MLNLMRHAPWVSLTGLYTAHVWAMHGLTPPAANTWLGRCIRWGLMPAEQLLEALYGTSLEKLLVRRHQSLDALSRMWLGKQRREAKLGFLELPCGLASRARRLAAGTRSDDAIWIEADLPPVILARLEILGTDERVQALGCDATRTYGLHSLENVRASLESCDAVCVTMEGLLNYFDLDGIRTLIAGQAWLAGHKPLRLLADIWPDSDAHPLGRSRHLPAHLLSRVTGSQAGLRGRSAPEIAQWFKDAGFERIEIFEPGPKGPERMSDVMETSSSLALPACIIVQADINFPKG